MGPKIRPCLREATPPQEAVRERHLAPGRSGSFHRRSKALALACRRSGRLCSRRGRPDTRDTKAAKRLLLRLLKKQGLTPKRIITDKLSLVRRSKTGHHARRRTPIAQGPQQPGGERSPTASKATADDAGISIRRRHAAFHLGLLGGSKSLRRNASQTRRSRHPYPPHPRHAHRKAVTAVQASFHG